MIGVKIARVVDIPSEADEWELFTASMDCAEAAKELTDALSTALRAGLSRADVELAVDKVMRGPVRKYGASDTEPRYVLMRTLDGIFG